MKQISVFLVSDFSIDKDPCVLYARSMLVDALNARLALYSIEIFRLPN